jgi:hypothetical protein
MRPRSGAIAEIGADYALYRNDPKSVWVDSSGVLLNLADTSGDGALLVSGTTAGGFSSTTGCVVEGSPRPTGHKARFARFRLEVTRAPGRLS